MCQGARMPGLPGWDKATSYLLMLLTGLVPCLVTFASRERRTNKLSRPRNATSLSRNLASQVPYVPSFLPSAGALSVGNRRGEM